MAKEKPLITYKDKPIETDSPFLQQFFDMTNLSGISLYFTQDQATPLDSFQSLIDGKNANIIARINWCSLQVAETEKRVRIGYWLAGYEQVRRPMDLKHITGRLILPGYYKKDGRIIRELVWLDTYLTKKPELIVEKESKDGNTKYLATEVIYEGERSNRKTVEHRIRNPKRWLEQIVRALTTKTS